MSGVLHNEAQHNTDVVQVPDERPASRPPAATSYQGTPAAALDPAALGCWRPPCSSVPAAGLGRPFRRVDTGPALFPAPTRTGRLSYRHRRSRRGQLSASGQPARGEHPHLAPFPMGDPDRQDKRRPEPMVSPSTTGHCPSRALRITDRSRRKPARPRLESSSGHSSVISPARV
jgi:hypothetical protein